MEFIYGEGLLRESECPRWLVHWSKPYQERVGQWSKPVGDLERPQNWQEGSRPHPLCHPEGRLGQPLQVHIKVYEGQCVCTGLDIFTNCSVVVFISFIPAVAPGHMCVYVIMPFAKSCWQVEMWNFSPWDKCILLLRKFFFYGLWDICPKSFIIFIWCQSHIQ